MPRSLHLFIVGLLVSLLLPPDPMLRSLHLSIVELPVSLLRSVLFVLLLIVGLVVSLLLLVNAFNSVTLSRLLTARQIT